MRLLCIFLVSSLIFGCLKLNNSIDSNISGHGNKRKRVSENFSHKRVLDFNKYKVVDLAPMIKLYPDAKSFLLSSGRSSVFILKDEVEHHSRVKLNAAGENGVYFIKIKLQNEEITRRIKL